MKQNSRNWKVDFFRYTDDDSIELWKTVYFQLFPSIQWLQSEITFYDSVTISKVK